jgi:hypothetical protein
MEKNNEEKITLEKMMLIQKSLAIMVKEKEQIIQSQKLLIEEKDNEINRLKDMNKSTEKKPEEIYKLSQKVNISDIQELKHQFDIEKLSLTELINTLKNDICKKNELIEKLNKELDISRNNLELERKLNIKYFEINSPLLKLNTDKIRVDYHRISCENVSIKVKLYNLEEKFDLITKDNELLLKEKENMEKNLQEKNNFYQNILSKMKNSYDKLVKNLTKISNNYHESTKKIMELSKFKINKEKEIKELNITNTVLEKENMTLKSENEAMRKRIQTNEYQINSLKNEIKDLEKTIAENKFSKKVFFVSYTYLSVPMNGNITIEKDVNGNFYFIIENRTSTRKLSFLDVDVTIDPNYKNKIIVNLLKAKIKEEYTTSEAKILVDTFNEFKKKVIELTDIGSETKSLHETNEKINKAQQKLNNFFNI